MRFPKLIVRAAYVLLFTGCFLAASLAANTAFAAVGVSTSELQDAKDLIFPGGDSLEILDGYSAFSVQEVAATSSGVYAVYEARSTLDPWFDEELPQLRIAVFAYGDQNSAHAAFDGIAGLNAFASGQKLILDSEDLGAADRSIFYQSYGGYDVDVFGMIDAEYLSHHLVHVNGNMIYQASLYREDGTFNQENVQNFADAVADTDLIAEILEESVASTELAVSVLFPPTSTELSTKSEKSSLNLSSLYDIPLHGTLSFDIYTGEPDGSVGTILDSSGISNSSEGDLYLYLNADGRLFAGIYAPDYDADCEQQAGWYRLETQGSIHPYEWDSVALHYGVGGFYIELNGEIEASCSMAQPHSGRDVYFGDYPGDSIEESMIGFVNDMTAAYSLTSGGDTWDSVLDEQLFLDLPNTDPDLPAFQFLKEEGIFLGSDGMLYPDNYLNRAEMTKVLLRSFDYYSEDSGFVPFWDVPTDAWYLKYLVKAYEIEMIEGNPDGSFAPAAEINRAEFFTMLYRLADVGKLSYDDEFRDVEADDWFVEGAAYAASEELLEGENYFMPSQILTRREAAGYLYDLLTN